jgi:hypothetical protein
MGRRSLGWAAAHLDGPPPTWMGRRQLGWPPPTWMAAANFALPQFIFFFLDLLQKISDGLMFSGEHKKVSTSANRFKNTKSINKSDLGADDEYISLVLLG